MDRYIGAHPAKPQIPGRIQRMSGRISHRTVP